MAKDPVDEAAGAGDAAADAGSEGGSNNSLLDKALGKLDAKIEKTHLGEEIAKVEAKVQHEIEKVKKVQETVQQVEDGIQKVKQIAEDAKKLEAAGESDAVAKAVFKNAKDALGNLKAVKEAKEVADAVKHTVETVKADVKKAKAIVDAVKGGNLKDAVAAAAGSVAGAKTAAIELTTATAVPFDVRRVTLHEALSQPFSLDIIAVCTEHDVDLESIVGQSATLRVQSGFSAVMDGERHWSGVVAAAEQVQALEKGRQGTHPLSTYFIRLVPRIWLMTQRTNHRIFQRLSIPDIVDKVLKDWHVEPVWEIDRDSYPKLEYKSQYGESDYAFFCRLLEEAGITFILRDKGGTTKLLLSDKPEKSTLRSGPAIHWEDAPTQSAQREFVTKLRLKTEVRPGAHQLVDFDLRNPSFKLHGDAKKAAGSEASYEQYQYKPGSFLIEGKGGGATPTADDKGVYRYDANYGTKRAQISLDAERTGRRAVAFETNVLDLEPGMVFSVEGHPHSALSEHLMLTSFTLAAAPGEDWMMSGEAVFIGDPYRPAIRTPKPQIHGVQSATVVGPQGQEIHVDELGRVRVQFPWDRDGKMNDESSVWMRVNQGWSGTGFGMINIPRIGQEVLVGFLDGDPDDPLVVGRVFNAVNPVPYKLPDNKTISGWKTSSSPAYGGYNEIKLEDRAHKELIYIQAQRDLHKLVKRDETHRIERKHHRTVLDDQHFIVKKNKKELIEMTDHLHVKGDRYQKIDKSTSLTVGTDQDEKVGGKHALEAGKEIHLKAGDKVVMEAGTSLTIKGPGGFVHIHSGGVDIVGSMVKINSGGSAGTGSGAKPTAPKDAEEAHPKDNWEDIEKQGA
jgi:type VI secretion system secreted protein VgrG